MGSNSWINSIILMGIKLRDDKYHITSLNPGGIFSILVFPWYIAMISLRNTCQLSFSSPSPLSLPELFRYTEWPTAKPHRDNCMKQASIFHPVSFRIEIVIWSRHRSSILFTSECIIYIWSHSPKTPVWQDDNAEKTGTNSPNHNVCQKSKPETSVLICHSLPQMNSRKWRLHEYLDAVGNRGHVVALDVVGQIT